MVISELASNSRGVRRCLKAAPRVHQKTAGIYGTVTRAGRLAVGQAVHLTI